MIEAGEIRDAASQLAERDRAELAAFLIEGLEDTHYWVDDEEVERQPERARFWRSEGIDRRGVQEGLRTPGTRQSDRESRPYSTLAGGNCFSKTLAKMKSALLSAASFLTLAGVAAADTLTWDYETGWNKGFVLTVNTDDSTISFYDRKAEKRWSQPMNNPKNSFAYLELLTKSIPGESIGQASDDGPRNTITIAKGNEKLVRKVFDVGPPGSIFMNKDYPVKTAQAEAERFRKEVDGFLLLSQLEVLKRVYYSAPEKLWWAEKQK